MCCRWVGSVPSNRVVHETRSSRETKARSRSIRTGGGQLVVAGARVDARRRGAEGSRVTFGPGREDDVFEARGLCGLATNDRNVGRGLG